MVHTICLCMQYKEILQEQKLSSFLWEAGESLQLQITFFFFFI